MRKFNTIITSIKNKPKEWYCYRHDFRTTRRIIIIESDDWGSIRVSSKKAWEDFRDMGYHVDERPYERYDILESDGDVTALAEVLLKFKDCHGNHPVFTLNYLSSNPDFDAIRENGLSVYCNESIEVTYSKYPQTHHNVLELVRKGINENIFLPQCHGREHFNVQAWMRALQSDDIDTINSFRYNMCGVAPKDNPIQGNRFMRALECSTASDQEYVCRAVSDGLAKFQRIWGFPSLTFVAPNYTWNDSIESVLNQHDVKLIQTVRVQHISDKKKDILHYSGEQNRWHQYYSIRNCFFEPATSLSPENEVNACFNSIQSAFEAKKIAVLSSHRINYASGIDVKNRDRSLYKLESLLSKITTSFPDVEFISSDRLIDIFNL